MRVESCCQALMSAILPTIDPDKKGVCIDVGVGTFAFYCELFAKLGFPTVAVEPLPIKKLRRICQQYQIKLIENCLSDRNGKQNLYLGNFAGLFNSNFSSLSPDWFGSSRKSTEVATITLEHLLAMIEAQQVTCLKLDIEGWEINIIKQLPNLSQALIPQVIMFEYGGGTSRNKAEKGWSETFFQGIKQCLLILQQCGYSWSIMIDYAPKTQEKYFNLQAGDLEFDSLFPNNAVYGNIISFYQAEYPAEKITKICQAYYDVGLINWLVNALVSR